MVRKAAAAVGIAATGLLVLGTTALATGAAELLDQRHGTGTGDDAKLSLVCNDDVNVIAVPIVQGNEDTTACGDIEDYYYDGDLPIPSDFF